MKCGAICAAGWQNMRRVPPPLCRLFLRWKSHHPRNFSSVGPSCEHASLSHRSGWHPDSHGFISGILFYINSHGSGARFPSIRMAHAGKSIPQSKARAQGRPVVLATASHQIYANRVAAHLQLFDRVLATEDSTNLSAHNKRYRLIAEYGEGGFDYCGNAHDDLPVWAAARRAYLVNPQPGVEAKAKAGGNVQRVIQTPRRRIQSWLKGLRLHQWVKNLLLFVPLLASHRLNEAALLVKGCLAFFLFGLCASSVYVLNDLLDLAHDRRHAIKRDRPFASGDLSIAAGIFTFPLLLAVSFTGVALFLPGRFTATLAAYYALTLAYSIALKRQMVVDIITLALLYTLRIIAGAFAFQIPLTFWMLVFSMFIFLSLALVKRYAELKEARKKNKSAQLRGRGYIADDLEMIATLGAASGYLSVMVLALYIQETSTAALYRAPQLIWLACPLLLFWISRTWLLAHRGQIHDDPVIFAVKDRVSLLVGLLFGAVFWIAT